jgi:hypothetical protein
MLSFKELQNKYQGKLWKRTGTNKRVYVTELIYYEGSKKYKIVYQAELNTTEYLNDLTEEKFFDFIMALENPYKVITPEPVITNNKSNNMEESMHNEKTTTLEGLSERLYDTMDDVIHDRIKIEKAIAISKLAQVILNIEKQKSLIALNKSK